MADTVIRNEFLEAGINLHGAELVSLKQGDHEYMWCGDKKYWNRVSPVLFPFVGKLNGQTYRYGGKEWTGIPQHGFARDSEFTPVENRGDEAWFSLIPDEHWKANYPFDFELRIGYRLGGKKLHVMWHVENRDEKTMFFSIGAHPAFLCPEDGNADRTKDGYVLDLNTDMEELKCGVLGAAGTLSHEERTEKLAGGKLMLTEQLFDRDALVIDSSDIHSVSILNPDGNAYLSVQFDAPQLGIWSPVGKQAPFVCIEPWYGRCDAEDYTGELQDRAYGNSLEPGAVFDREYVISVM